MRQMSLRRDAFIDCLSRKKNNRVTEEAEKAPQPRESFSAIPFAFDDLLHYDCCAVTLKHTNDVLECALFYFVFI